MRASFTAQAGVGLGGHHHHHHPLPAVMGGRRKLAVSARLGGGAGGRTGGSGGGGGLWVPPGSLDERDASGKRVKPAPKPPPTPPPAAIRLPEEQRQQQAASSPPPPGQNSMATAAARLQEFTQAFSDLPQDAVAALAATLPGLGAEGAAAKSRARLQAIVAAANGASSSSSTLPLASAARLVARCPQLWARDPSAVGQRIAAIAAELSSASGASSSSPPSVSLEDSAALLRALPQFAADVTTPGAAAERVQRTADALGVRLADAARLVAKQPLLCSIPKEDVRCPPALLAERLGLSGGGAGGAEAGAAFAADAPVALALRPEWLRMSVPAAAAATGLREADVERLLARSPPLAAADAIDFAEGVETAAQAFFGGVRAEAVLDVLLRQPTLLAAQAPVIERALDTLAGAVEDMFVEEQGGEEQEKGGDAASPQQQQQRPSAPGLPPRERALRMLVEQPSLLYEAAASTEALLTRLDELAAALGLSASSSSSSPRVAAFCASVAQPALLAISPGTLRAALSALRNASGGSGTNNNAAASVELLRADPGAAVRLAYASGGAAAAATLDSWASQLSLPRAAVAAMAATQPALLDMAPTTLKARVESLAALFSVRAASAAQLLLRHPALASVPPNATITRAKSLSMATRRGMAMAGDLIARCPAALVLPAAALAATVEFPAAAAARAAADEGGGTGEGGKGEAPPTISVIDAMLDISAAFEFYGTQWLMSAARERQPRRETSFAQMAAGGGGAGSGGGGARGPDARGARPGGASSPRR
jgi:hypothetical protein